MYIRTITRRNKRKPDVTYVQLAHNFRDPHTGQVKAKVLYHFGRADQLDLEAIRRLVRSLSRFLPPEERLPLREPPRARSSSTTAAPGAAPGCCAACENVWGSKKPWSAPFRIWPSPPRWSGPCSPWWRAAPWPPPPNGPSRSGSRRTSTWATRRRSGSITSTGRWTSCWNTRKRSSGRVAPREVCPA